MDVIGSLLNEAWNEALEADDVDGADIEQEITFDERSAKRGHGFALLPTRPNALLVDETVHYEASRIDERLHMSGRLGARGKHTTSYERETSC